jgi:hypothetical protein
MAIDLEPIEALDIMYKRTGRVYYFDPATKRYRHDNKHREAIYDIDLEAYEVEDDMRIKQIRKELDSAEMIFAVLKESKERN